jgi:hypothetical protein
LAYVKKNCDLFVSGPLFAMERIPRFVCFTVEGPYEATSGWS